MNNEREQVLAKQIGLTLAEARRTTNLTQSQVAERLGLGDEAVSRMERGLIIPTIARLIEFAEIYDCEVGDLLAKASDRPKDQAKEMTATFEKLSPKDRGAVKALIDYFSTKH